MILFLRSNFWLFFMLFFSQTSFGKYNVRLGQAPLIVFSLVRPVEIFTGDVMYQVSNNINVGYVVNYLNNRDDSDYKVEAFNVGVRADLHMSQSFTDGFYLSNAVLVGVYRSSGSEYRYPNNIEGDSQPIKPDCTLSFKSKGGSLVAALTVGYQWFWENGFNVNIGLGMVEAKAIKRKITHTTDCLDMNPSTENYSSPWFDFGFGFVFG